MITKYDGDMMQEIQHYATQLSELWQEKIVLSAAAGTIATLFGIDVAMLLCVSILMVIDLWLGLLCAWLVNDVSLGKLRRGAMKFFAYYLSMFLVGLINGYISSSLGIVLPIQNLYVTYLIATEAVSIMGHCSMLGMPFPPLFQKIINGYRDKVEHTVENIINDDTHEHEHRKNL